MFATCYVARAVPTPVTPQMTRARGRAAWQGWLALAPTLAVVAVDELALMGHLAVPVPFLLLLTAVVATAGLGGSALGALAGTLASAFVIHSAVVGWGPETLTGGALQASLGCALMLGVGVTIGRVRTQRDELLARLQERQRLLEAEVAARTAALEESHARVLTGARMQALGVAAGSVAHEFNNLLTPILANASLLLEPDGPLADRPDGLDLARGVERAAERAALLVSQMLTFSRRRPHRSPDVIAPTEVVTSALDLLGASLGGGVVIARPEVAATDRILVDPVPIQQALMNLCVNARDAMNGDGSLAIGAERLELTDATCSSCGTSLAGAWAAIYVRDDGPGIPAAALEHVFEPFFSTKDVGKGTGMGLALVHGAVHAEGGHILLRTSSDGTRVSLLFPPAPLDEPRTEEAAPARERNDGQVLRGTVVAVVDDDADVRDAMVGMLTRSGATSDAFASVDECLGALRRLDRPPDVVVTDLAMTGRDGLELVEALQAELPDVGVLLCTGHADEEVLERARRAGVRVLKKPVSVRQLCEAVARAAAERRAPVAVDAPPD